MKLNQILSGLLVAGLVSCSSGMPLDEINEHLTDTVKSNDIGANMDSVRKLIMLRKASRSSRHSRNVIQLEHFLALDALKDLDNKCGGRSYEILYDVGRDTGMRGYAQLEKLEDLNRVDYIVNKLSMDHYELCKDVYPVAFAAKYPKLDETKMAQLEEWAKVVFRQKWPFLSSDGLNQNELEHSISSALLLREDVNLEELSKEAPALLEKLAEEANDPDVVYLKTRFSETEADMLPMKEKKVWSLIDKYLLTPCEYFSKELGSDVFLPWELDLLMVEPVKRFESSKVSQGLNKELRDAYVGFIKFGMCKTIIAKGYDVIEGILGEFKKM